MAGRFINPRVAYYDSNGVPLVGGQLFFYVSGTSTPLATYSDENLTTANTNPIILDTAGRAGNIFMQDLRYKVVLQDAAGNTIFTADPVVSGDSSGLGYFIVTAYGARGDGVTDDSDAFRDALAAASAAGGGVVYFPKVGSSATTYLFDPANFTTHANGRFLVPNNVQVTGASGVTLKTKTYASSYQQFIAWNQNATNVTINGLTIDLNSNTASPLGTTGYTNGSTITNLKLYDLTISNYNVTVERPEDVTAQNTFSAGAGVALIGIFVNLQVDRLNISAGFIGVLLASEAPIGYVGNINYNDVTNPMVCGFPFGRKPTVSSDSAGSIVFGNMTFRGSCGTFSQTRAYTMGSTGAIIDYVPPYLQSYYPGASTSLFDGVWRDITIAGQTYSTLSAWSTSSTAYVSGNSVKMAFANADGALITGAPLYNAVFMGSLNITDKSTTEQTGSVFRGSFVNCDMSNCTVVTGLADTVLSVYKAEIPNIQPVIYAASTLYSLKNTTFPFFGGNAMPNTIVDLAGQRGGFIPVSAIETVNWGSIEIDSTAKTILSSTALIPDGLIEIRGENGVKRINNINNYWNVSPKVTTPWINNILSTSIYPQSPRSEQESGPLIIKQKIATFDGSSLQSTAGNPALIYDKKAPLLGFATPDGKDFGSFIGTTDNQLRFTGEMMVSGFDKASTNPKFYIADVAFEPRSNNNNNNNGLVWNDLDITYRARSNITNITTGTSNAIITITTGQYFPTSTFEKVSFFVVAIGVISNQTFYPIDAINSTARTFTAIGLDTRYSSYGSFTNSYAYFDLPGRYNMAHFLTSTAALADNVTTPRLPGLMYWDAATTRLKVAVQASTASTALVWKSFAATT